MKKSLLLTLLSFLIVISPTAIAVDNTSVQHFGVSATFGYMAENFLVQNTAMDINERVLVATAMASLPGLVKELSDPVFDQEDMAFNVMGAFVGAMLGQYFNKYVVLGFERDESRNSNAIGFRLKF